MITYKNFSKLEKYCKHSIYKIKKKKSEVEAEKTIVVVVVV